MKCHQQRGPLSLRPTMAPMLETTGQFPPPKQLSSSSGCNTRQSAPSWWVTPSPKIVHINVKKGDKATVGQHWKQSNDKRDGKNLLLGGGQQWGSYYLCCYKLWCITFSFFSSPHTLLLLLSSSFLLLHSPPPSPYYHVVVISLSLFFSISRSPLSFLYLVPPPLIFPLPSYCFLYPHISSHILSLPPLASFLIYLLSPPALSGSVLLSFPLISFSSPPPLSLLILLLVSAAASDFSYFYLSIPPLGWVSTGWISRSLYSRCCCISSSLQSCSCYISSSL